MYRDPDIGFAGHFILAFWPCGLFCFDLVCLCSFVILFLFLCHSRYLDFIYLFSYFTFCLLRLSFFPLGFLLVLNRIRHVFHLALYFVAKILYKSIVDGVQVH